MIISIEGTYVNTLDIRRIGTVRRSTSEYHYEDTFGFAIEYIDGHEDTIYYSGREAYEKEAKFGDPKYRTLPAEARDVYAQRAAEKLEELRKAIALQWHGGVGIQELEMLGNGGDYKYRTLD